MAKLLNLETSEDVNSLFVIGRILKVHGIKGKLKVNIIPELLPFIDDISSVYIVKKKYDIVSVSLFKKNSIILSVENITDISQAQKLVGNDIEVDKKFVIEKKGKNIFELEDLLDFQVIDQNEISLGKVKDFYKTPHFSYIELNNQKLIPFIKEYIIKIDNKNKKIYVDWNE
ncbi:MAG: ribosome maturation factor RimM [Candidatus Muirbacterium halophilum]|nr:ribosome maturation factor RimM [Candidatus Muirbacterium halophilum]MCK9475273.1 ribosome maturation factor RimM [Candidatus Muirbacterium halophilum]